MFFQSVEYIRLFRVIANHCVISLELSSIAEYSKVGVPGLPPGILQDVIGDVPLGGNDPICNIAASGGGDLLIRVLIE
jgi:hypothetical protein